MKKAMKFVVMAVAVLSTTVNYASISDLNVQDQLSIKEGRIQKKQWVNKNQGIWSYCMVEKQFV